MKKYNKKKNIKWIIKKKKNIIKNQVKFCLNLHQNFIENNNNSYIQEKSQRNNSEEIIKLFVLVKIVSFVCFKSREEK